MKINNRIIKFFSVVLVAVLLSSCCVTYFANSDGPFVGPVIPIDDEDEPPFGSTTVEVEGFSIFAYKILEDNTARITLCKPVTDGSGAVTLPSHVDGYEVSSVGSSLFGSEDSVLNYIAEVNLPDTLKVIDSYAFSALFSLVYIKIPESVVSLEKHAFFGCKNLSRVYIPAGVSQMNNSFYGCSNSLTFYGYYASYAFIYAKSHHYAFVDVSETPVDIAVDIPPATDSVPTTTIAEPGEGSGGYTPYVGPPVNFDEDDDPPHVPPTKATKPSENVPTTASATIPSTTITEPGEGSGGYTPYVGPPVNFDEDDDPPHVPTTKASEPSESVLTTASDTDTIKTGDVNGDGKVDINDATAVQKFCCELETIEFPEMADVNMDGKIDVTDATLIQMSVAGLYTI